MRSGWLFALLMLLGAGCDSNKSSLPLVGTLERDRLELVAEASEPIVEVPVREGDRVRAGDLLLRLDNELLQARYRVASGERDAAAQRLAELVRGPRQERIREARARLEGARQNLSFQSDELERIGSLVLRQLAAEADLERQRNLRDKAQSEVSSLEAVLDELVAGTTSEELGQAEARLAQAEAGLAAAEIALSRLRLLAPRDGRIDALPYKLGERPAAGATLVVMLAEQAPYARVYVPEPLRSRVTPGLEAEVSVDGSDQSFTGRVRYVAADATFTPYFALTQRDRSRLAFVAEVTLTDATARELPSGVPVEVDFPSLH